MPYHAITLTYDLDLESLWYIWCHVVIVCSSPSPLYFVAPAKFEVSQPIRWRLRAFLLLIHYVTL